MDRHAVLVARRAARRPSAKCPSCGRVGTLHLVMDADGERRACVGTGGRHSCGYAGVRWHRYARRDRAGKESLR